MALMIGKKFIIARCSEDFPPAERLPIILAHGQAFGSGEHETTRSSLEELEEIPVDSNTQVLDLGCGTGVLAIAAARMHARFVIALDPVWEAIKTAAASIKLNGLNQVIAPVQGEIAAIRHWHFDLIMANLYGDILLDLVRDIAPLLNPSAYLLLSGIQYEYTYDMKTEYMKAGCQLLRSRYLDEYATLLFQKKLFSNKTV